MEATPKKEFNKTSKEIKKNLESIIESWEYAEGIYKDQLKKTPKSWKGLGRGSELNDLLEVTEKMKNFLEMMKEG